MDAVARSTMEERATFTVATETVDVVFHGTTWWGNSRGVSLSNESPDRARSKHGLGDGEDSVRTRDYVTRQEVREIRVGSWIDRPTLDVGPGPCITPATEAEDSTV